MTKWVPEPIGKIGRSVDRARQRAHVADLPEDVLHEVDDVAQQVAERSGAGEVTDEPPRQRTLGFDAYPLKNTARTLVIRPRSPL